MKKLVTFTLLTIGLGACASLDFADRSELIATQGYEGDIDELVYTNFGEARRVKTLGTLTMNNFSKKTDEDDGSRVFNLKRDKSRFFAETTVFTSDNKDKSFFDETAVNFGVDKKKKGLNVEFSMKF